MDKKVELEKLKSKWAQSHDKELPEEAIQAIENGENYTSAFYRGEKAIGINKGFISRFKEGYKEGVQNSRDRRENEINEENDVIEETSTTIETNDEPSPVSKEEEEAIRERARIEHDEKQKLKEKEDDEDAKGCLYLILLGFAISGAGSLIAWIF